MKKVGRWRSLALIGLALASLAASSFLWLRYNNAGEPISPETVLPGHAAGVVISLEFFQDSKTLLSAYEDGSVRLWDVDSGQLLQTKKFLGFPGIVDGALVSNDGRTVAVNGHTELRLWKVSTGEINILKLKLVEMAVDSIQFSPDSRTIASVVEKYRRRGSIEYSICIWDVETGALLHTLDTPDKSRGDRVWYSPDSKRIVDAHGNTAKVWDVKTGAPLHTFHGIEKTHTIALSPDRSQTAGTLAAVCAGPSIKVWDLETGALLHTLHGASSTFKYSPDGKRIASVSGNAAKVWDMKTGAQLHTSEVTDMGLPYIVDYSPDGKSISSSTRPAGPARFGMWKRARSCSVRLELIISGASIRRTGRS
ncbi:MAG: hypothetical protein OXT69_13555 [Candidatus Poribacteria bacterium]|nr:hypothetical protein [Candidatus Poribacteria bacterium]